MKQKLDTASRLLIGVTLFSMFFGAGNLIFPPYLGFEAGQNTIQAFLGFTLTAVVCPVLGVAAVAKAGGLDALCEKVHPKFGLIFSVLIYLCIGPMLAIPRTAGTSYSMFSFLTDLLGEGKVLGINIQILVRAFFSFFFFLGAGCIAKHPEKLRELLGKRMTPVLLVLILVMFAGGIAHISLPNAQAAARYESGALLTGFVDGYQTMDTMAAMVFGIIIALNLRDMGVTDGNAVAGETIKSGIVAGIFLAAVYGMLAFLGVKAGSIAPDATNGTAILTALCSTFFGRAGAVLLALIFFIACFNVCVGLISSCAKFFAEQFPVLGFDQWRWLLTIWSFGISIMGLDFILSISVPILSLLYPTAIAIILVNILPFSFLQKSLVQRIIVAFALICGIMSVI